MTGILFCLAGFFAAYLTGRRSLWLGATAVLVVGVLYAWIRAHFLSPAVFLMFDLAIIGLYLAAFSRPDTRQPTRQSRELRSWLIALMAWCGVLLIAPFQDVFIRLAGLRTSILYLAAAFIGLRFTGEDLRKFCVACAAIALGCLAVALGEYFLGLERFFPRNITTELMYRSEDVAGGHWRIPSTFSSAHAYGGTMGLIAVLLLGALFNRALSFERRAVLFAGFLAAAIGVFMCGARSPVIPLLVAGLCLVLIVRLHPNVFLGLLGLMAVVAYFVLSSERLQRFTKLFDTEQTLARVGVSANAGFFDLLAAYPFGNGLGGSGVGVPYFLSDRLVPATHAMENEYARIVLDLGWIGLFLVIGLVLWYFSRGPALATDDWRVSRRLVWVFLCFGFASAFIGTGFFVSVPASFLMFLLMGWSMNGTMRLAGVGQPFRLSASWRAAA